LFNDAVSVDEYGAVAGIGTGIGNRSAERKPDYSATPSPTDPTRFDLGFNPVSLETDLLSYGTAKQENRENRIMRSFIICTLRQILLK
jgi:hypothetical protein